MRKLTSFILASCLMVATFPGVSLADTLSGSGDEEVCTYDEIGLY